MAAAASKIAHASEMLAGRLKKIDRRRRKWARRGGIECYRVFDRDIPEIPLTIDRYADHLVIGVLESERTHADLIDALAAAAADALDVAHTNVHTKTRGTKVSGQYEKLDDKAERLLVQECGLRFWANLDDYLDTGLFLDHRPTRGRVRDEAAGKSVLNLFAYTGAFSVYAAAGGAERVVTVDLSKNYLRWAEANFAANDLDGRSNDRFVAADVRVFLDDEADAIAEGHSAPFDIVVLDPPTFSVSKRMDGDFDIQRDHPDLIAQCHAVMAPGGILYFSNNLRTFAVADTAFDGFDVEEITKASVPEDFSHSTPHRCWRAVRR